MKKNNYILLLITAITLAACSTETVERAEGTPQPDTSQPMEFLVNGSGADADDWLSTRGAMVNTSNLTSQTIALTAVKADDESAFLSSSLSYSENSWQLPAKYFWPPYALSFYARHPLTDQNVQSGGTTQSFTYTTAQTNSRQVDLMYGYTASVAKGNTIAINMKHALAAISFQGKTESASMTVKIGGIDFCNVLTSATFTYPTVSTTSGSDDNHVDCFTNKSTAAILSAGVAEAGVSLNNTDYTAISATDGAMILIPQTATAWTREAAATAEGQTGTYLVIHCHLKYNGHDFAGTDTTYGDIYVPYGGTFEAGKHYTVSLDFGMGYDVDGQTQKVTVGLTAKITPWDTSEVITPTNPLYPNQN